MAAYEGTQCAGTKIGGNYSDGVSTHLFSPWIQLPGASQDLRLQFQHWFSMSTDDYGYAEIQVEGGSWTQLGPRYASTGGGVWSPVLEPLSSYAGQRIRIGFYFYSHNYGGGGEDVSSGWYVDNVRINGLVPSPPVIECPSGVAGATVCAEGEEACIPLQISNADAVTVAGATWANNQLCFEANSAGTYDFTVVASNGHGTDTCDLQVEVSIVGQPTACFTPHPEAGTLTVSFENCSTPSAGLTYAWDFGDQSTSTAAAPTHTYQAAGSYTATLQATNDCGTHSTQRLVVVNDSVATLSFSPCPIYLQPASHDRPSITELWVDSGELVMGATCRISYDKTKVRVNSIEVGPFLSTNGGTVTDLSEYDNGQGLLTVALAVIGGDPSGVSGTGNLMSIELQAVSESPTSELTFVSADLRDPVNHDIPVSATDCQVLPIDCLLGDFDRDGDVDFADFTRFIWCMNEFPGCAEGDIAGPITGAPPPPPPWRCGHYPYPPDGAIDFEDLMCFAVMYNWSGQFGGSRMAKGGCQVARPTMVNAIGIEVPEAAEVGERIAVRVPLAGLGEMIGIGVDLAFNKEALMFEGTNLDGILKSELNLVHSLDEGTDSGVRIRRAVLGGRVGGGAGVSIAEFYFRARRASDGAMIVIRDLDLRDSRNASLPVDREALGKEWRIRVEGGATSLPTKLALWQNAPNPFGAQTMIRVDLPQPRHVELTIYDIQGRSVATILDEEMIAGTHEVAWDGRDGGGEPLASGIYFCILRTEGYRQAIRMMLAH